MYTQLEAGRGLASGRDDFVDLLHGQAARGGEFGTGGTSVGQEIHGAAEQVRRRHLWASAGLRVTRAPAAQSVWLVRNSPLGHKKLVRFPQYYVKSNPQRPALSCGCVACAVPVLLARCACGRRGGGGHG